MLFFHVWANFVSRVSVGRVKPDSPFHRTSSSRLMQVY